MLQKLFKKAMLSCIPTNMKLRKTTILLTFLLVYSLLPSLLFAQPGFGDDVDDIPVDGGLVLLLAAGIGHIATKSRKNLRKS